MASSQSTDHVSPSLLENSSPTHSSTSAEKQTEQDEKSARQKQKPPTVPFLKLFRFTTRSEKIMMAFGCICAVCHGALMPLWTIVFGDVLDTFSGRPNRDKIVSEIGGVSKWFIILAVIAFVLSYFQVYCQMLVAHRTGSRIRKLYFRSLMSQDAEWYDSENSGELTTRVASDVDLIQAGIGDKVGSAAQFLAMFFIGFIIAFIYTWKLTLVILSLTPVLAACGALFGKLTVESTGEGQGAYGAAGAIAAETLSLIKTVSAFGGQEEEARRYERELDRAYKKDAMKGILSGLGLGITMFLIFCSYALSFWYGAKLVRSKEISIADIFIAFFSVLMGAMGIGQAAPSFTAFQVAQGAAPRIYEVIDRKSPIDPLSDEGEMLPSMNGNITFENVNFNYRSREVEGGAPVLRGFNLHIPVGSTQALVGPSGCGKSSTLGLIERFYDVNEGRVLLDGADIRSFNVTWLRSKIGYVGQMPTLFRATIRENIALGAAVEFDAVHPDGSSAHVKHALRRVEVTDEEIIEAAKLANAHNFITKLPEGYNTMLGERGAMLSGGQKQRICIARAIVRNPKILLLDEATSALDAQSERLVQSALERAAAGRTTVVVAHRLSTIRNADKISVIKDGEIVESGSHNDLLQLPNGAYRQLIELQQVRAAQQAQHEDNTLDPDSIVLHGDGSHAAASKDHPSASKTGADSLQAEFADQGDDSDKEAEKKPFVDRGVFVRAFKLNRAEWLYISLGIVGAAMAGASWPLSAYTFSKVTNILGDPRNKSDVSFWALMYVAVGGGAMVGNALQLGMLGISGARLTRKMRGAAFRALLKQEMAFFDQKDNSTGALTTRLATEATLVKGITGDTLGSLAVTLSTIGVGMGVAFAGCWRLALVVLCTLPIMAVSGYFQMKMMTGFDAGSKKEFAGAGAVASEAVDNIRTISGLGVQDYFIDKYDSALIKPVANGKKASVVGGVAFGFSEAFMFGLWAIAFWVGAKFISQGQCDFLGVMMAVTGLLFAGITLGNVSIFMPDISAAQVAATKIFRLLDRESQIDPSDPSGGTLLNIRGDVSVQNAEFEYPSRPHVRVLRGLSMGVGAGKTLALVGESGCGKSTIVALLERFYDLREGTICLDDSALKELNLQNARSHMALVQQEPDLFNRTVGENIAYGLSKEDGTPVTQEQIVDAAKAANAHDFVSRLPQGYDTPVGERGSALSGGERQRVAIARSLVRQPRTLLLDEATSALDARSERVVQDALDEARLGRTTIIIAHRLSTIKDADLIGFVARGKIAELGTHGELMDRNGGYATLVRNQMMDSAQPL